MEIGVVWLLKLFDIRPEKDSLRIVFGWSFELYKIHKAGRVTRVIYDQTTHSGKINV